MKNLVAILSILIIAGCSSTSAPKSTPISVDSTYTSSDPKYGFSEEKPIMLGGFLRGTKYEGAHYQYFNSLVGPNGQSVNVRRLGSCCGFEDASLPLGGGMLDMYELSYTGQKEPVVVYVNLYKFEMPKAPIGFKLL